MIKSNSSYLNLKLHQLNFVLLIFLTLILNITGTNAQTATVTAFTGQSCAGTRFGSDLNCTANDFSSSLTFDQPAATALSSCISGQQVTIDILASVTSNSPVRYDGAFFTGENGVSPSLNNAANSCSIGVFPSTPLPYQNLDVDSCGDYAATSSSTLLIKSIKVNCKPAPGTNLLALPYTLVFNNQVGSTACTPANVTAATTSKCVSSSTATVTGVVVNGYIKVTKATNPVGEAQSFGFTSSSTGTQTPASFSLTDGASQFVQVPFSGTGAGQTLTVTESAASGWGPDASIACLSPSGGSASSYVTVNNTTRTITANLTTTNYGVNCTVNNYKIPVVAIQKKTIGGTGGPFSFTQTNLASTPASISTSTANTATPTTPTAINVTTVLADVTITEPAVSGYVLSGANCTDGNSALTGNTGSIGTLVGNTLTIPATDVKYGSNYICVFTNQKLPTLTLTKISVGGTGSFIFTGNNGWSSQTITTATAGTGLAGATQILSVIGTATTINEAPAGGFGLTAVACTGLGSGGTATVSGNSFTFDVAATAAGSAIACTVTNKTATVKVQKITSGGFGGPFSFTQTNLASTPTAIATTVASTATPASPTAINATTLATTVTLTEPAISGFFISSASCSDANSAFTGNTGLIGTLSTTTLTIPAVNIKAGSDFTCVFTNIKGAPQLTIVKTASSSGPFSVGQVITYTYKVTNNGNVAMTAIVVADTHNGNGIFVGPKNEVIFNDVAPASDSSDPSGNNGIWDVIGVGDTVKFTATYTVTQNDIDTLQ